MLRKREVSGNFYKRLEPKLAKTVDMPDELNQYIMDGLWGNDSLLGPLFVELECQLVAVLNGDYK